MLKLLVGLGPESYDEDTQQFVFADSFTLRLEHSLLSLSKWESRFEKPFLGRQERTTEETFEYIKMMCLDEEIPPGVFSSLTSEHYEAINQYINAKMSATTINERPGSRMARETITSELVYYWMISLNVPFSCETWHLNRLLMLLRVCNHKNSPPKKANRQEMLAQRRALNEQRLAQRKTKG